MEVALKNVSKRYHLSWIFKNLNYLFDSGVSYGITGPNGSGKTTLLKIISSYLSPSKGEVKWNNHSGEVARDEVYRHVTYSAPYIDVIDKFTLFENIQFHQKFKPFLNSMNAEQVLEKSGLGKHKDQLVSDFSSGMKQRVRLVLSICAQGDLLILDEPTSNLDSKSVDWYLNLIDECTDGRTVIVASNEEQDYSFTSNILNIQDFKN